MSTLERHHPLMSCSMVVVERLDHVVQQLQIHGIFFGSTVERQGMHVIAHIVHRLLVLRRQARVREGQFKMNALGHSANGTPPQLPRHELFGHHKAIQVYDEAHVSQGLLDVDGSRKTTKMSRLAATGSQRQSPLLLSTEKAMIEKKTAIGHHSFSIPTTVSRHTWKKNNHQLVPHLRSIYSLLLPGHVKGACGGPRRGGGRGVPPPPPGSRETPSPSRGTFFPL